MAGNFYLVSLKLQNRNVLIIGAGTIAERKIMRLLQTDASITVIAPVATAAIEKWAAEEKLLLHNRAFNFTDLENQTLVFAATSDAALNIKIAAQARQNGQWVNVATDSAECNFHLPAEVSRGPLRISVSTDGECPALTRQLKSELERQFGPEWEPLVLALGRVRQWLHLHADDYQQRKKILESLIAPENRAEFFKLEPSQIDTAILEQTREQLNLLRPSPDE